LTDQLGDWKNWEKNYDTVIVSAGYAGLIAGTILAKAGKKVAIVEKTHRVGGRVGCAEWNGYWLDFGHRDDDDYEDNWQMISKNGQYFEKASKAAGVSVPLVPILPATIIHEFSSDKTVFFSPDDPAAPLEFGATMAGATPEQIERLKEKLGFLATQSADEWLPVGFGEWLQKEFPDPVDEPIHRTMLWMAGLIFALPPEKFSIGRYIQLMQDPIVLSKIDDKEVGGMQGLPEAYAREFLKAGGDIYYGVVVDELLVEAGKAKGLIARDEASVILKFNAENIIYSLPVWRIFDIVDEKLFDPEVAAHMHAQKAAYEGDSLCMNIGLSRRPTIRATGELDYFGGYHGFAEDYMGANGWIFNSTSSPKTAPEGKHLLWAGWFTPAAGSSWEGPFKSFAEGKKKIDTIHQKMREYYSDLDEVTEWVNYQWHKGYWGSAANFWTQRRGPLTVDTIKGLYFAGSTVEIDGLFQEISAHSGLEVAQRILGKI
jgi:phytoene dehydrogenase-like protein